MTCALCGRPIESMARHAVAKQVVGWDVYRSGGGQNHLLLRKETGALAHTLCVRTAREGVEQETLWSESGS